MKNTSEINEEAIEPKDYFKILKSKIKKSERDKLEKQLETLGEQILQAKKSRAKKLPRKTFFLL